MKQITLEQLLEAGCHFGHQVTRSNPKARDFVFEARDNIQIIDLVKTKEGLDEASQFVKSLGQRGGSFLVVGTKRQAKEIIVSEVKRVRELLENEEKDKNGKLFYITQRWIGGILTNFSEVSKNFKKLKDLKIKVSNPEEKARYTKKELGLFEKEIQRLENFYSGILDMTGKPDALFVIDCRLEDLAVREANSTKVETVAIVDTNADPYLIDHPIPANDDAVGSIKLIVSYILDSWYEGVKLQKPATTETQKDNETLKIKKPATTEARKEPEALKDKKPAATETQKKPEAQKRKRKNVSKK